MRLPNLIVLVLLSVTSFSQGWSADQLKQANTAIDVSVISSIEKQAIEYINLARLFPKDFIKYELKDYQDPYQGDSIKYAAEKNSLADDLRGRHAIKPLTFDKGLYESAKCFAEEQGASGAVGHSRKKCPKLEEAYGECCSYGMETGKDIAMQWLVDLGVPSHGHRMICLDEQFSAIGLSEHAHKKYSFCAVADFR
jgi:uncharacterized protein YkwD